jgi:hypothetical protein
MWIVIYRRGLQTPGIPRRLAVQVLLAARGRSHLGG